MRRFVVIMLILTTFCTVRAQEFRCVVQVNYQKLMTSTQQYESAGDKKVFESMKQALEDYEREYDDICARAADAMNELSERFGIEVGP